MTELSTTSGRRDEGFVAGRARSNDDTKSAADALKRRVFQILAAILAFFLIATILAWLQSRKVVEVQIAAGSSIIEEINRQTGLDQIADPRKRAKQEVANYRTSIRIAEACAIPAYRARTFLPSGGFDRITYDAAYAAADTTAWRLVNVPVYPGDVLSTRGGDHCKEGNTIPFDQR